MKSSASETTAPAPTLNRSQLRAALLITAAAIGLYLLMRWLPIGSDLSHMDFRVAEKGAIEFCDPNSPQFIPVISAKSPVEMSLRSDVSPTRGKPVNFTLTMRTASGKPIGPADLLVAHTRKLHLLIVDPTLNDYQHLHPEPGRTPGEWVFSMVPERAGTYRVFADFTPAATARGLYAAVDFEVPGDVARVVRSTNTTWQSGGYNFTLDTPPLMHAGRTAELKFRIESQGATKRPVPLQPVMDAYAHLVAFDDERTGFAHLHPNETNLAQPPDALRPELTFKVLIPRSGRYVVWAQINLAGKDVFVPFWVEVLP
jgi:hypothetical protein